MSLPADVLCLEVAAVGPIRLPVKPAQAKKLCAVASPAKFGHRDETILDPAVRDTWEISPDLVSLAVAGLEAALAELADELGIPAGCRVEAEPHALLVYGPGQFFVPHADTEKNDAMIGTLTVTLPSSHTRQLTHTLPSALVSSPQTRHSSGPTRRGGLLPCSLVGLSR